MKPRRAALVCIAAAVLAGGCARGRAPREDAVTGAERERVIAFWRHFRAATERRTARDFAPAVRFYRQALDLDPRHEDSLYYLGQCLRELRQPIEAREAFERLVEVNPATARGHLALGALLASPDASEPFDLPQAERHFRRAHEINGEETGPMVRLAEVLIARGQPVEARHWLESAAQTNPKSVEAAFLASYLAWADGDARRARHLAERALAAARVEAPPKGVLGEGDRRAADGRRAAPPLESPMGRMLFGEAVALVEDAGRRLDRQGTPSFEAAWQAASRRRSAYARRAADTRRAGTS